MANLYGTLNAGRKPITRTAGKTIYAILQTWNGNIRVDLYASGKAIVSVNDKEIWRGNVDEEAKK